MICCANLPDRTKYRLNDEQLASILRVPVHSGTKMQKHWADLLRTFLEIGATDSSQILRLVRSQPDKIYIGGRWLWCQLKDFFEHYPELDPECHFHKENSTSTLSNLKIASILQVPPPGMCYAREEEKTKIFYDKKLKLLLEIGATNIDQLHYVANDPLLGGEALTSRLKLFFQTYPHLDLYCKFDPPSAKPSEIIV